MDCMNSMQIFLFCVGTISATTHNHTGDEFVVAFFRNLDLSKTNAYLLLTPVGDSNVTTTVWGQTKTKNLSSSVIIRPRAVEHFSFKKQFGNTCINMSFPVFTIKSSHPVSVTAFVIGLESASSYLALPVHVTTREYRMMPVCEHRESSSCVCTIVTLSTNTEIILKNENHSIVSVMTSEFIDGTENVTYKYQSVPGKSLMLILNSSLSYVSLESDEDFTGLLAIANNNIAVFCGTTLGGHTLSMEQIFPVEQYNLLFYPFFMSVSLKGFRLKFIAHYNCTNIEYSSKSLILDAGQYREIRLSSHKKSFYKQIRSNKPIAALQMPEIGTYDQDFLMLPSVDQYTQSVVVPKNLRRQSSSMRLGFNYLICFMYTFNNQPQKEYKVNYESRTEHDHDGKSLKMEFPQTGCLDCENSFGFIVLRTIPRTYTADRLYFHVHVAGYNFTPNQGRAQGSQTLDWTGHCAKGSSPLPSELSYHSGHRNTNGYDSTTTDPLQQNTTVEPPKRTSTTSLPTSCPPCHRMRQPEYKVLTEEELQERIKMIKKTLLINKKTLSSYRRRKSSADDDRWSARGIGMVGACVLCAFASIIFIMDFNTLSHQLAALWRKTFR